MKREGYSEAEGTEEVSSSELGGVSIILTPEEREILVDVLDTCLSDLRMQIAHTDRQNFRDMLKERKKVLMKVRDRFI
ncbi:MAG: hypothetical protein JSV26_00485 [bacterium]|nr:MAG: hypothetical protein JSV26_00485 [bacterium]